MPDPTTDRRSAPRYPLILIAEVSDKISGAKFTACTSDISRTGCYIDILNPIPAGSQVGVRLQHEGELFEVDGRVHQPWARHGYRLSESCSTRWSKQFSINGSRPLPKPVPSHPSQVKI